MCIYCKHVKLGFSIYFIVFGKILGILSFEIFTFYLCTQIRSVYNGFNMHQRALVRPTEFAKS